MRELCLRVVDHFALLVVRPLPLTCTEFSLPEMLARGGSR